MTDASNKPQRLFYFLAGLSELSRKHGIVIEGSPDLEFKEGCQGAYALNPNNEGPEFGWRETA